MELMELTAKHECSITCFSFLLYLSQTPVFLHEWTDLHMCLFLVITDRWRKHWTDFRSGLPLSPPVTTMTIATTWMVPLLRTYLLVTLTQQLFTFFTFLSSVCFYLLHFYYFHMFFKTNLWTELTFILKHQPSFWHTLCPSCPVLLNFCVFKWPLSSFSCCQKETNASDSPKRQNKNTLFFKNEEVKKKKKLL